MRVLAVHAAVLLLAGCPPTADRGFGTSTDDDDAGSDDDDMALLDDDDGAGCDVTENGLFILCPEGLLPRDVDLVGSFAAWSVDEATFLTDDGVTYDLQGLVQGDGADGVPDLGAEPALILHASGACEDPDKGGVTVLVSRFAAEPEPLLLVSSREETRIGDFVVTSPHDETSCEGVDRGGCWTNEHAKPVRFDDGSAQWTSWQGPAAVEGPWLVSVNVAFSGSGEVRCDDCCSTERLGWWLAAAP